MSNLGLFPLPVELRESDALPTPPGVVVDLMRLINDPDSTAGQLGEVIERDAVLSARILGTVNSGLYTLVREIHSIRDATVLVGFKTVRTLALGASVADGIEPSATCANFDLARYWSQSLMTALLSRKLATRLNPRLAEEAFTIGLIADIGRLVLSRTAAEPYDRLLGHFSWPTPDQEIAALGFSNRMIGAGLLSEWQLPDDLCHAVLDFERPDLIPETVDQNTIEAIEVASVASSAITQLLGSEGLSEDDDIALTMSMALGLPEADCRAALNDAADNIDSVGHMIGSNLPDSVNPMALLAQARDLFQAA